MPPKKSLFADPDAILLGIHHGNITWSAALKDELAAATRQGNCFTGAVRSQLADAQDGWVVYSLELFSGRSDLTESHKQIWRREVRRLESEGIVERAVRLIRLTDDGRARVTQLLEDQDVQTKSN